MSRIKLSDIKELSDKQKKQYKRFPANLTRTLLKTTTSTKGYLSLGASFPKGAIVDKEREMVILRVGAMSKSAYERMQHLPLARRAGWNDEEIASIEQGKVADQRLQTILQFVDECVRNVKVSENTFEAVKAFYSETQLAELTLLIGHYMMTARFLESLEVPLDTSPTQWDNL